MKPKFVVRTETTAIGSYKSKVFGLKLSEKGTYEVDGEFTAEEVVKIVTAYENLDGKIF